MKKRILIISKNSYETSTEDVIDWIKFLKHDVVRINGDQIESLNENVSISNNNCIKINNQVVGEFYSVWLRRWSDVNWINSLDSIKESKHKNEVINNIANELGAVRDSFLNSINAKKWLTKQNGLRINKLMVFNEAQKAGFNIPNFLITNNKNDLTNFFNTERKIVTKDINIPFTSQTINEVALGYVELINQKYIDSLPDNFILSMFQKYIEKEIEIRVFFLDNKLYSMAIFSQNDPKTKIDFRKYNNKLPNRNVPFILPNSIEELIKTLMKNIGLNTGSIDLIKSTNNQYYFLEVNPVGQFGMVSYPCNYNLEGLIANYLTE